MQFIYILFSVILFSQCKVSEVQERDEGINNILNPCSVLDTSINNEIFFLSSESIESSFPNIDSAWKLNDRVYFINEDSSKYLSLGFNYGGSINEYKEAEVGYIEGDYNNSIPAEVKNSSLYEQLGKNLPDFYYSSSKYENFTTAFGISLGMSTQNFMDICKHKDWAITKEVANNSEEYSYYNDYCMYESKYIFKDGRLTRFSFGYVTP